MSELLLRLAGDATVRGTITSDGEHVGSVYNFINLACNKHGTFAYKVWERLISENSVYRDELYKLFTLEYVKGLSGQIDDLSHTKKTRSRQTPALPLRDLQRLLLIFWGLFPSHPQKINYSIRCEISKPQQDVRAAAEARRRCEGAWNHHPWWVPVFSAYDFINLVCQKMNLLMTSVEAYIWEFKVQRWNWIQDGNLNWPIWWVKLQRENENSSDPDLTFLSM